MNNIIEFRVRDKDDGDGHSTLASNRIHLIKAIRRLTGPKRDLEDFATHFEQLTVLVRDMNLMRYPSA